MIFSKNIYIYHNDGASRICRNGKTIQNLLKALSYHITCANCQLLNVYQLSVQAVRLGDFQESDQQRSENLSVTRLLIKATVD